MTINTSDKKMVKRNVFELSEEQKADIINSIHIYIKNIENTNIKEKYELQMKDINFRKKLIIGFAEISFLSSTIILGIKNLIDFNTVYNVILNSSKNDIFEVQELKLYIINALINEDLNKNIINKDFNFGQLKEYRQTLSMFKRDYLNLFE